MYGVITKILILVSFFMKRLKSKVPFGIINKTGAGVVIEGEDI